MDKNRVARNSRQVRPLFDPFRLPVFQDRRPFPGLRVFQKGYRPIEALPRLYRNHVLMERTPNTTLALDFLDVFHALFQCSACVIAIGIDGVRNVFVNPNRY